jgi:hypothetical protein
LAYRDMLSVIRQRLRDARAEGLSFAAFMESEPARGYAPNNDNTEGWMRMAWDEYE